MWEEQERSPFTEGRTFQKTFHQEKGKGSSPCPEHARPGREERGEGGKSTPRMRPASPGTRTGRAREGGDRPGRHTGTAAKALNKTGKNQKLSDV